MSAADVLGGPPVVFEHDRGSADFSCGPQKECVRRILAECLSRSIENADDRSGHRSAYDSSGYEPICPNRVSNDPPCGQRRGIPGVVDDTVTCPTRRGEPLPAKAAGVVLERQVKPRRADDATHITLLALSRFVDWRGLLTIVKPETLIRWPGGSTFIRNHAKSVLACDFFCDRYSLISSTVRLCGHGGRHATNPAMERDRPSDSRVDCAAVRVSTSERVLRTLDRDNPARLPGFRDHAAPASPPRRSSGVDPSLQSGTATREFGARHSHTSFGRACRRLKWPSASRWLSSRRDANFGRAPSRISFRAEGGVNIHLENICGGHPSQSVECRVKQLGCSKRHI